MIFHRDLVPTRGHKEKTLLCRWKLDVEPKRDCLWRLLVDFHKEDPQGRKVRIMILWERLSGPWWGIKEWWSSYKSQEIWRQTMTDGPGASMY